MPDLTLRRARFWVDELIEVSAKIGWEEDQGCNATLLDTLKARRAVLRARILSQLTGTEVPAS